MANNNTGLIWRFLWGYDGYRIRRIVLVWLMYAAAIFIVLYPYGIKRYLSDKLWEFLSADDAQALLVEYLVALCISIPFFLALGVVLSPWVMIPVLVWHCVRIWRYEPNKFMLRYRECAFETKPSLVLRQYYNIQDRKNFEKGISISSAQWYRKQFSRYYR